MQAVQTWRYGDRDLWRRAAGSADVEVWRSGAREPRCRLEKRGGVEVWRCDAGVLPLFASRDLELGRHAVGLATSRHVEV